MKMRTTVFLLISTMVLLEAQQPPIPPMPPGPPVQMRAPDPSQWVIKTVNNSTAPNTASASTTTGEDKAKKSFYGSQIIITKTGKIMCRQTLDDLGRAWNVWCVGDIQITVYPNGKDCVVQARPDVGFANPSYEDYSQTDFTGFWWVSQKNYAGIKSIQGKPCLYFKDRLKFYSHDEALSDVEAYVDLKTRLPVSLAVTGVTHTYEFSASPPAPLVLPDIVETLLSQRAKVMSATRG